jgi:hypothetical protein
MIVLIDTDVLIDVALDRRPFSDPAGRLLDALQEGAARLMWRGIRFPTSTTWWLPRRALREPRTSLAIYCDSWMSHRQEQEMSSTLSAFR